jgi:hypothetical protein
MMSVRMIGSKFIGFIEFLGGSGSGFLATLGMTARKASATTRAKASTTATEKSEFNNNGES